MMTAGEIIDLAWQETGRATTLDPSTTNGADLTLKYYNLAQKKVAAWKDKVTGRQFKFKDYYEEVYEKNVISEGTVQGGSDTNTVIIETSDLQTPTESLVGAVIEVNGEKKVIISNSAETCTVDSAYSTDPTGETYTLYRKWIDITLPENFLEINRVEELETKRRLSIFNPQNTGLSNLKLAGTPARYRRVGQRLYFDIAGDEERVYRLIHYVLPPDATATTDVSELPETMEEAIKLYLQKLMYDYMQEHDMAYAQYNAFVDFMRTTQNEYDVENFMDRRRRGKAKLRW